MGFVIFIALIMFLIVNEVRKAIIMSESNTSDELQEDDYFDDLETL